MSDKKIVPEIVVIEHVLQLLKFIKNKYLYEHWKITDALMPVRMVKGEAHHVHICSNKKYGSVDTGIRLAMSYKMAVVSCNEANVYYLKRRMAVLDPRQDIQSYITEIQLSTVWPYHQVVDFADPHKLKIMTSGGGVDFVARQNKEYEI